MTEQEWLASKKHDEMLSYLRSKTITFTYSCERKVRLFMCACCRLGWELLATEISRRAVNLVNDLGEPGDSAVVPGDEERQMPSGTFDPARMNILADALLDAGCDNEDIIQHCRSTKDHVRGCWVVDLILRKE